MSLSIGSLFSGIGGLELGLEAAGLGPVLWQVEKNAFCRAVLKKNWPGVKRYARVQHVGARNLKRADLICGGFPCQDLSPANPTGAGLAGARSGLWDEFKRIVGECKPDWVVIENTGGNSSRWVPAIGEGLEQLGYASFPIPLEARQLGAPHIRSRVFVVAHTHSFSLRDVAERLAGWASQDEALQAAREAEPLEHGPQGGWPVGLEVVSPDHGVSPRVVQALGNSVVPQCAEVVGHVVQLLRGEP